MKPQLVLACHFGDLPGVVGGDDLSADRIFEADKLRVGKDGVIRFDGGTDLIDRYRSIGVVFNGLGLDASQHGGSAAFVGVGMGVLADDIFVASPAMGHYGDQIAHRTATYEERGLFVEHVSGPRLQAMNRRIVTEYIVTDRRFHHCPSHLSRRVCDGVASQIDHRGAGGFGRSCGRHNGSFWLWRIAWSMWE